ncbi:MAG: hypothetical protein CVU05_06850 [Bacteroidetes bacterium HGW-Bacteroidetes-21]|nr:MAG: hypothetical protein CVU05_06850 [Bacteroidetes bacterium HGW-Bacteroidetes-21]
MINNSEHFSTFVLPQIKALQEKGFYFISFIMMVQAIEYLGGLMDNKPLKAREQSKKRFNKAISTLFGSGYKVLNRNDELYNDLRNPLLHTLNQGSKFILLSENNSEKHKHFQIIENKTVLIAEEMYHDITVAFSKLKRSHKE